MRRVRALVAALAVACSLVGATTGTAASAAARAAPAGTRSAHVALDDCNARQVVLRVTAPKRAFQPGEPVTVEVRLTNTGSTTCGTSLAEHVPQARRALTVGPCGTLPLTVRNDHGLAVYPGPVASFCPDEAGFRLGPHSTARATASWSQAASLGNPPEPRHAPPGTYRLTVDRAVTVPVTVASG
jgi:hypothetical protein